MNSFGQQMLAHISYIYMVYPRMCSSLLTKIWSKDFLHSSHSKGISKLWLSNTKKLRIKQRLPPFFVLIRYLISVSSMNTKMWGVSKGFYILLTFKKLFSRAGVTVAQVVEILFLCRIRKKPDAKIWYCFLPSEYFCFTRPEEIMKGFLHVLHS